MLPVKCLELQPKKLATKSFSESILPAKQLLMCGIHHA